MEIVLAQPQHLESLCAITDSAKAQLKGLGLDQWQKGYPNRAVWEEDIQLQRAWVAVENGVVLGGYTFEREPDPSYAVIDGAWRTDGAYASFHRVCVAGESRGRGIAGALFRHGCALAAAQGLPAARMDTHPGNAPMQRAMEKEQFVPCGTIILVGGCEDGDLRIGYERVL